MAETEDAREERAPVKTSAAIRVVLGLLTRHDRFRLGILAVLQFGLSLLDLFGIFLIALLGGLLISGLIHGNVPRLPIVGRLPYDASSPGTLLLYGAAAAGLLLAKSIVSIYLLRKILGFLASRETEVAAGLTRRLLAAPLVVIRQESSFVSGYAVGAGVTNCLSNLLGFGMMALADIGLLLLLGVSLVIVDPLMTLVSIVYFMAVGALFYRYIGRRAALAGEAATAAGNLSMAAVVEALSGYRELAVLDRREFYVRRFRGLRAITATRWAELQLLGQLPKLGLEAVLVGAVLLMASTQLVASNPAKIASLLALFLAASTRILPAVLRLQTSLTQMRQAVSQAVPTFELVDRLEMVVLESDGGPQEARPGPVSVSERGNQRHPGFSAELAVTDVTFTYPGSEVPALSHVSLVVPPGSHVAVVGPSGGGKSTLMDIMLGVLSPQQGSVAISGLPPAQAIKKWPGSVAYVPQDAFLTSGPIAENVALAVDPHEYDFEAIWRALRLARIDEVVAALPEGLDTRMGERGHRLSGGQRQRLGLARALYSQPRMLLLDEATSALDADTEREITAALEGLRGNVSTLTVAHRWATVRDADRIYYLVEGRILAAGTFDDLVGDVPDFARQAKMIGLH